MEEVEGFLETLKKTEGFENVKFVFLFGSYAYGKPNKLSDIDFAVFYDGDKRERFNFRLKISSGF